MTHKRIILKAGQEKVIRKFRRTFGSKPAKWLADWQDEELAVLDDQLDWQEIKRLEAEEQAADEADEFSDLTPEQIVTLKREEAGLIALCAPTPRRPHGATKAMIRARQTHRDLWMRAKSPDDFRTQLISRLIEALNVARSHHDNVEVDAVIAQLREIGAEPPDSVSAWLA